MLDNRQIHITNNKLDIREQSERLPVRNEPSCAGPADDQPIKSISKSQKCASKLHLLGILVKIILWKNNSVQLPDYKRVIFLIIEKKNPKYFNLFH